MKLGENDYLIRWLFSPSFMRIGQKLRIFYQWLVFENVPFFSPQTLDHYLNFRITPWVAVPGLFILASQSWMTQVLVHGMVLPLLIFCKYQTCLRSYRPQTKFFAMWSLATFAFLFYIYQFHVVGILHWPKTVSPIENLCLMGNFFSSPLFLYRVIEKGFSLSFFCLEFCHHQKV